MCSNNVIGSLSRALNIGQFEWLINLSDEILETEGYLDSPTFSFSHSSWYVRLYPKSSNNNFFRQYMSLYLRKKETQSEIYVEFSLEMSLKGKHLIRRDTNHIFKESDDSGWLDFIPRKKVLDLWSAKDCSQLTIKIRMSDNVKGDKYFIKQEESKNLMRLNFMDLLLNDKGRDLILKVKDREFQVHRNIMQCRSPVFKSMLDHDMLEKNEGVVEISDCDSIAFEKFLIYVYTGQFQPLDESVTLGLYYIADKYDIESLKKECREYIKKSLSAHNIGDVIKLALNHNDSSLLECGKKYYVDNVKEILVSKEWQSFFKENPNVVNELFINWSEE